MDSMLWLVRILLMNGGTYLAARGYGDTELWGHVAGAVVAIVGAVWSYIARRQALAETPPNVAAQLKAAQVTAEAAISAVGAARSAVTGLRR